MARDPTTQQMLVKGVLETEMAKETKHWENDTLRSLLVSTVPQALASRLGPMKLLPQGGNVGRPFANPGLFAVARAPPTLDQSHSMVRWDRRTHLPAFRWATQLRKSHAAANATISISPALLPLHAHSAQPRQPTSYANYLAKQLHSPRSVT